MHYIPGVGFKRYRLFLPTHIGFFVFKLNALDTSNALLAWKVFVVARTEGCQLHVNTYHATNYMTDSGVLKDV